MVNSSLVDRVVDAAMGIAVLRAGSKLIDTSAGTLGSKKQSKKSSEKQQKRADGLVLAAETAKNPVFGISQKNHTAFPPITHSSFFSMS